MNSENRWVLRQVPRELGQRYEADGWWTDDTLGGMVSDWLALTPAATVNIWSKVRPWRGTYADIDDEARRLVSSLQGAGIEFGSVVAFQLPTRRAPRATRRASSTTIAPSSASCGTWPGGSFRGSRTSWALP